jgi:hypothetical protein
MCYAGLPAAAALRRCALKQAIKDDSRVLHPDDADSVTSGVRMAEKDKDVEMERLEYGIQREVYLRSRVDSDLEGNGVSFPMEVPEEEDDRCVAAGGWVQERERVGDLDAPD